MQLCLEWLEYVTRAIDDTTGGDEPHEHAVDNDCDADADVKGGSVPEPQTQLPPQEGVCSPIVQVTAQKSMALVLLSKTPVCMQ